MKYFPTNGRFFWLGIDPFGVLIITLQCWTCSRSSSSTVRLARQELATLVLVSRQRSASTGEDESLDYAPQVSVFAASVSPRSCAFFLARTTKQSLFSRFGSPNFVNSIASFISFFLFYNLAACVFLWNAAWYCEELFRRLHTSQQTFCSFYQVLERPTFLTVF